jgi:hypothetical protein
MKQRLILGVVAALATSVWVAPAASAQITCSVSRLPQQDIVTNGGGQVNVYPANVVPYATEVAGHVSGLALCVANEAVGPTYACAKALVNNRPTVTVDPETLQITVDYGDFLGTACSLN